MISVDDVLLGVGLLIACYTDLNRQKIPNALTFSLIILGIASHWVRGDFLLPLIGVAAAFALHFVLWMLQVERGGDAKLMMGVGAFYGWSGMLAASVWTLVLLFPVGLTVLAIKGRLGNFFETLRFAWRKALGYPVEPPAEKTMMPFAPVLACAVLAARLLPWPASLWS